MKKILFICEGNICRSPTAEVYFNHRVAMEGLGDKYVSFSRGLIFNTNGHDIYRPLAELLHADKIVYQSHSSKMVSRNDVKEADYVLVMEASQKIQLKRNLYLADTSKISRLGDYLKPKQDIEDPYVNRKFEEAYSLIKEAVDNLIEYLKTQE